MTVEERIEAIPEVTEQRGHTPREEADFALRDVDADLEVLDEVFGFLEEHGVSVYDGEKEAGHAGPQSKPSAAVESAADELGPVPVDDTISLYFREMGREPLLSREQEIDLAKRIEGGEAASERLTSERLDPADQGELEHQLRSGVEARAHLIRANTRLVVSIAKTYRGRGMPFSDLIQEGNLGLMKAVGKFDHHLGNRFSTYATWWIRQTIGRALPTQGRTIRISTRIHDRMRRLYETSQRLEQELGRRPTPEEIAQQMELEPEQIRDAIRASYPLVSLDKPVGEYQEDSELGSLIENVLANSPTETAEQEFLAQRVEQVLDTLEPREAQILRLRFGLQDGHSYTLKEVASKFGLTRERIRQIQNRALRRLRHPSRARLLRDYMAEA